MKKLALALFITTALSSSAWAITPAERQMNDFGYVSQVSQPVETRTSGEYMPKAEPYKEHAHKHGKKHHHKKDGKAAAGTPAAHPHHHHHHKHDAKKDVKTDVKQ